jgi:hypothetical protein
MRSHHWCSAGHRFHQCQSVGFHQRSADKNIRSRKEPRQIMPFPDAACKAHVQTSRNRHRAFAECHNDYNRKIWQMRQLLKQPRHIFVFIGQ